VNQLPDKDAAQKAAPDAAKKARDGRNIVLGLGLVAFVVLVFVVTLVRLGANVAQPHL
jgi:t-SNARE complex subunit (syntaxin)